MALKIEVGDMFTQTLGQRCLIVHGCNAQGVMGSGVAAIVKKLYPEAYKWYKTTQKLSGLKLGHINITSTSTPVHVGNAITQEFYGRDGKQYVSYDAVVLAMQAAATWAKNHDMPVHLPLIGGGLGGGDQKRLTAIFQAAFHDVDATLWLKED